MKLFEMKSKKYIVKCKECKGLAKFKINTSNFLLSGECENGHSFSNLSFENFNYYFIKKFMICKNYINNILSSKCYNCKNEINCICGNKDNQICLIHNLKYEFFNNNQILYLCKECIKNIPFIEKKNEIKMKVKEYNKKIEEILKNLEILITDIRKRYEQINNFLLNMKKLNEKLLMKFNYTIFNDYNYDNFNHFFNL